MHFCPSTGNAVIYDGDDIYVWSPQRGLENGSRVRIGMWLQPRQNEVFAVEIEDVYPFPIATAEAQIQNEVCTCVVFILMAIEADEPDDLRNSIIVRLEEKLGDPAIFQRLSEIVKDANPSDFGYDISLIPATAPKLLELLRRVN